MTSRLHKCMGMGVYEPRAVDRNFGYWAHDWKATNTGWVRFWICWHRIAPHGPSNLAMGPDNPATDARPLPGHGILVKEYVAALDAQIRLARQLGLGVILAFDYFPSWVTGSTDPRKPPADVGIGSLYARYLYWIMARWSVLNPNNNGAYANIVEVCNEPNLYHGYGDNYPDPKVAANMMLTAQTIQQYGLPSPMVGAPAVADSVTAAAYTEDLLSYLRFEGYTPLTGPPGGNLNCVWTQHNYSDLEKRGSGWSRAQEIREVLRRFRWKGWPYGNPAQPYVLITEGGVRRGSGAFGRSPAAMASRTASVYNAVHNDRPAGGEGLALFSNLIDVSTPDPAGDCGLRDYAKPYKPRPLYASWARLRAP